MLALAGGDLEQALIWTEWTMEFNASVFSPERCKLLSLPADPAAAEPGRGASAAAVSERLHPYVWRRCGPKPPALR